MLVRITASSHTLRHFIQSGQMFYFCRIHVEPSICEKMDGVLGGWRAASCTGG